MAAINWTDRADEEMAQIIEYWANQSENSARLQIRRIFDKIEPLESFPRIGRIVPELDYPNVRELFAGPYRIIYHVVSDYRIDVLAIHHASRPLDIDDLG